MKVNVEEVKKYRNALNEGASICYKCGGIDPECGFTPLLQTNLSREEISTLLCNDCYRKIWKDAEKSDVTPESIWGYTK